jgi:predicted patatin/cPLA2 family phospholipase
LIDHFHDANDFADAIKASCFLPLICGLSLYTNFRGNKCIDGGVTMPVPYKN